MAHRYTPVFADRDTGKLYMMLPPGNMAPLPGGATLPPVDPADPAEPAGPASPPATGPNVYPLRMQPVATPGASVELGKGAHALQLLLSGNPTSAAAGPNVVNVFMDGVLIAQDLVVSSFAGQGARGQVFTLRGEWGEHHPELGMDHRVTIDGSLTPPGKDALWINAVQYDGYDLGTSRIYRDARNQPTPAGSTAVWVNFDAAVEFSGTAAVVGLPAEPTPSVIKGAMLDGSPVADATLDVLAKGTPAGGRLVLPSGTFTGTTPVGAIQLEGQPDGSTILDATGLTIAQQKGLLLVVGDGFVGRFLTLRGAACSDMNGAGIRQSDEGLGFRLEDCIITGCQDGALTFPAAAMTFVRCHFHGNGAGLNPDATHELYANGTPDTVLTLEDTALECGPLATHALKSRCGHTIARGCLFRGNGDDGAVGGAVVNVPNGGELVIEDSDIHMGVGAGNTLLLQYGSEGSKNAAAGMVATLRRVTVHDTSGSGGKIVGTGDADLVLDGCLYPKGGTAPILEGWQSVTGAFTEATA